MVLAARRNQSESRAANEKSRAWPRCACVVSVTCVVLMYQCTWPDSGLPARGGEIRVVGRLARGDAVTRATQRTQGIYTCT